jgi:hypothetical protein
MRSLLLAKKGLDEQRVMSREAVLRMCISLNYTSNLFSYIRNDY